MSRIHFHSCLFTVSLPLVIVGCQGSPSAPPQQTADVSRNGTTDGTVAAVAQENSLSGQPGAGNDRHPDDLMVDDDPPTEIETALQKLSEAETPEQTAAALQSLEQAIEKEPGSVEGVTSYYNTVRATSPAEGRQANDAHRKAANLFRQALQAKASLQQHPYFVQHAVTAMYDDACAKALDHQLTESLAALREAVALGWTDLGHMSLDADLAEVRETDDYQQFFKEAQEAFEAVRREKKASYAAIVPGQLSQPPDFEFDFTVTDVTGNKVAKADLVGRVLMIDFWATWCGPCVSELPDLAALHGRFHEQGLEIVGFNIENSPSPPEEVSQMVRDFCKEREIPYSTALLQSEVSDQVPNLTSIPTKLFFDRQGKLRLRTVGKVDPLKIEVIIEHLLSEEAK